MLKRITVAVLLLAIFSLNAQTPLSENGKLKLVGNQLSNECGYPVQLKGMSTHGPFWFKNCYSSSSMQAMANDWGADIVRLAMYTEPDGNKNNGYLGNVSSWDDWIDEMVNLAESNGMYIMIDWHILSDNDPHKYKAEAKTFFAKMSQKYKDKSHVLYEICNEPNGNVSWATIKSYAEELIPVIRANDPDGIIIVGTPEWSGRPWDVGSNKLTGDNAHNVMYTFHFYSGSHFTQNQLKNTLGSLPIFVTEWGTSHSSGDGGYNSSNADTWLAVLNGDNTGGQKVSWCNWSFADKSETSAGLSSGACSGQQWTNTSQSGTYVRAKMNTADNFQTCTNQSDADGDGIVDVLDNCPNTPNGATVNNSGCSDTDGDGIFDNFDLCAGTTQGATIDDDGCELNLGTSDFTAAIDNFDITDQVTVGAGEHGIFWWVGTGSESTYDLTRSTSGMTVNLTNASPTYKVFGLSFGEIGSYINLKDLRNADIHFNITNNSNADVFLSIQLQDINENKAEIFIEEDFGIDWGNQWEKIGLTIPQGQTLDYTIPLSEDPNQIGGFQAGAYNCDGETGGSALTCPATSYEIDASKITQLVFIVNGGAGVDNELSSTTGALVFNYFSIGEIENDASNIIEHAPIEDTDGDGVADEFDSCPSTVAGETVNSSGCALSTLDTDGDGINDDIDECANTFSGSSVDDNGCSLSQLDDDSDGVSNDIDLCTGTVSGLSVDDDGCAPNQLDTDEDGITDDLDDCPNTATGLVVGSTGCVTDGIAELQEIGVYVFPIPATDYLNVKQEAFVYDKVVVLTPTSAEVITIELTQNEQTIDISELANGVYFLKFYGNDGVSQLQIVVE